MKLKVFSGGQTGADLAGLWVAKILELPTGGTAPLGYMTTAGDKPALKELFGLDHFGGYRSRTIKNVRDTDMTLIFSRNMGSPGTVLTKNSCLKYNKPCFMIPDNRHPGETLSQFWGKLEEVRHEQWARALFFLLETTVKNDALGIDDCFLINIAGNSTKKTNPEAFDFAFVSLWNFFILYGEGLEERGLKNPFQKFSKVDPVKLALELKDRYEARTEA